MSVTRNQHGATAYVCSMEIQLVESRRQNDYLTRDDDAYDLSHRNLFRNAIFNCVILNEKNTLQLFGYKTFFIYFLQEHFIFLANAYIRHFQSTNRQNADIMLASSSFLSGGVFLLFFVNSLPET